jgi:hypothetical protein
MELSVRKLYDYDVKSVHLPSDSVFVFHESHEIGTVKDTEHVCNFLYGIFLCFCTLYVIVNSENF